MLKRIIFAAVLGLFAVLPLAYPAVTEAQPNVAPCGTVDGFDFPIPDINLEHTDFGMYRTRYQGLHTGMDVAFGQLGFPVRAAATGQVTFSDVEGWDTEKGVVVIQHTFPDGTQVSTVYGHMEELHGYTFPPMDSCVERGDIVGAVGDPSQSAVHLHFEVRNRYRHEGGPGYTQTNPLELGWFNPVDFAYLARLWILPAHVAHFSMSERATLPLLSMPDGGYVAAQGKRLAGLSATGQVLWQFDTMTMLTGLLLLPDSRILATNTGNQVLVLNHGSYSALWSFPGHMSGPPVRLGNAIIFASSDNILRAFTPEGQPLWQTAPMPAPLSRWAASADRLAVTTTDNDLWIVDGAGTVLLQHHADTPLVPFDADNGEFLLLSGTTIARIDRTPAIMPLFDTGHTVTSAAEMVRDGAGNLYLYPGDGRVLYAYGPRGNSLWVAYMPGSHLDSPLLAVGDGSQVYAVTTDGQLLAHSTADGHLVAQLALYDGGEEHLPGARWLDVGGGETVRFSSGYLSVVTLDGRLLGGDGVVNVGS